MEVSECTSAKTKEMTLATIDTNNAIVFIYIRLAIITIYMLFQVHDDDYGGC